MDAARVGREIESGQRMQRTHPNGSARGDGAESDIDTMFDEILGGFGESNLALDDPRTRRGHHADDSIVSLISSYEGDTGDPPPPRPTGLANTYSSQRPASRPGDRLRPLPQVPGAPAPAPRTFTEPAPPPPLPSTMSMPSPEPYQHPSSPGQPGPASAYLNAAAYIPPGPANALLGARRQLPSQPETFGMPSGIGPSRQPTGGTRRPHTAGSDTLSSPISASSMSPRLSQPTPGLYRIPTVQVGGPEEYQPNYPPLGPPPGAMMPSTPGSNANASSSTQVYRSPSPQPGYEPYGSGASYAPPSSNNAYAPSPHPPRTTSRMPSADIYSSSMATLSPTSGLGRSTSTTSSIVGVSRAPSLAAGSDASFLPTSVDRANSKSSNWSANSNAYPGAKNYPASTISYETGTNNDAGGYLDLPGASSPISGPSYRQDQHYLEERIATAKGRLELHEDDPDDYDYSDEDETLFVNLALLSHLAVKLRDKVPRGTHVKGSIPYNHAFTGKDIVVRI